MQDQDLEALWTLDFLAHGNNRLKAGVAVLDTNTVVGGDTWYYYTGTYKGSTESSLHGSNRPTMLAHLARR
jgi:hypothetical protein